MYRLEKECGHNLSRGRGIFEHSGVLEEAWILEGLLHREEGDGNSLGRKVSRVEGRVGAFA